MIGREINNLTIPVNLYYWVLFLFVFVSACKKENENSEDTTFPANSNAIIYKDFQPDLIIHSVDTFYYNWDPESCGDTPFPSDSSASLSISVDGDTTNDFSFFTNHYIDNGSGGSIHCVHAVYSIGIAGIHPGDSISLYHTNLNIPANYDTVVNTIIYQSGIWAQNAFLSLQSHGITIAPYASFSDTYIGIKTNIKFGWIHISPSALNGILINECAINAVLFQPIHAGQKF